MAPSCRFRFGMEYKGPDIDYTGIDYLTIWIGQRAEGNAACAMPPCFNPFWHGDMLHIARTLKASVVYYAYIIAFLAKRTGLYDCDVGSPNLCERGASYIRQNEAAILRTYSSFANETAARLGSDAEVLWLIEPDFHQYHEGTQESGGLSHSEMVTLFNRIVSAIVSHLPKAKISFDISPWVNNQASLRSQRPCGDTLWHHLSRSQSIAVQEEWLQPFIYGCRIDFFHTSGGRTTADSHRIRANDASNMVTWRQVTELTGKGIIADTGYGIGGASMGLDSNWEEPSNLRARSERVLACITMLPHARSLACRITPVCSPCHQPTCTADCGDGMPPPIHSLGRCCGHHAGQCR